MTPAPLPRRVFAEALGTASLLCAVVGSGVMGERLADGNVAIALLANTLATGCALVVLILALGPVSGAHMNPAVTLFEAIGGRFAWRDVAPYTIAQIGGALAGVVVAHVMFSVGAGAPDAVPGALAASTHVREGAPQIVSEAVATCGLLVTIAAVSRFRATAVPFAVAAYIMGAYWFTSSTSFANPAATIGRAFTDTFAGIRPADAPGFFLGQAAGLALALAVVGALGLRAPAPEDT
jgi:glycerol uptake facilitator-like aquaporin